MRKRRCRTKAAALIGFVRISACWSLDSVYWMAITINSRVKGDHTSVCFVCPSLIGFSTNAIAHSLVILEQVDYSTKNWHCRNSNAAQKNKHAVLRNAITHYCCNPEHHYNFKHRTPITILGLVYVNVYRELQTTPFRKHQSQFNCPIEIGYDLTYGSSVFFGRIMSLTGNYPYCIRDIEPSHFTYPNPNF